jgi:hypothetical protein
VPFLIRFSYSLDKKKAAPAKAKSFFDNDDDEGKEVEADFDDEEDDEEDAGPKKKKAKPKSPAKPKTSISSSYREDDDDEPLLVRKKAEKEDKVALKNGTSPAKNGNVGDDSNHTEELPVTDMEKRASSFLARADTVVLDLLTGCKIFLHGCVSLFLW